MNGQRGIFGNNKAEEMDDLGSLSDYEFGKSEEKGSFLRKFSNHSLHHSLICVTSHLRPVTFLLVYQTLLSPVEEGELIEGEEGKVVGFGLKKLLRSRSEESPETLPNGSASQDGKEEEEEVRPKRRFSLDFPPGLVHDESECETSPKRWKALKKILQAKRQKRKSFA